MVTPISLIQSSLVLFPSFQSVSPRPFTLQCSSFWMFLIFSRTCRPSAVCDSHGVMYLDFGWWLSSCVYTVLKLLRFFLSLVYFLFVCLLSAFSSQFSLKKKKKKICHLTLIYVGLNNPNDPTDLEPREDGAETKPKRRHRFETFQSRSACVDQQNLGRWLVLLCLTGVVWTNWLRILSFSLLLWKKVNQWKWK